MTKVRVTLEFDTEVEGYAMYDPLTPGIMEQLRNAGIPMDGARYIGLEVIE